MANTTPGTITTDFSAGSLENGYSVTLQADGKILVAGSSSNGTNYDFALARYNTDGSLDTSFDTDGRVTTAIGTSDDYGYSATVQADGKILVAGFSNNGTNYDFALARYNTDGSLDTSFDTDGRVATTIGTGNDYGYSATVQADGKILVAGSSYGTNSDFALARYNTDGSLDTSFDTDGRVATTIGTGNDTGYSATLQSDGKILVAGYSDNGTNIDFALARYNTDGSLDTSFGTNGKVTTAIGAGNDYASSATLQADGKILVAGNSYNSTGSNFVLARYNTDGSLDTSFDSDGRVATTIGTGYDDARNVTLQADGKILVAGYSSSSIGSDFALARYNTDGSLDTSFDTDGMVTTDFGASDDIGYSATLQADGKILVAGTSYNGTNSNFALARYNTDGSLDTSFGLNILSGSGTITGTSGADSITGSSTNDILNGGAGDDTLTGGAGDDTLTGGAGIDTFNVDAGTDTLADAVPGTDVINISSGATARQNLTLASVSYAANTTNSGTLVVNALASTASTITGSSGVDIITGSSAGDTLGGGAGNDTLNGAAGNDVMEGGSGADIYYVDSVNDSVIETTNVSGTATLGLRLALDLSGTIDQVIASISYTLGNFLENLDLAAGTGNLTATGNELDNVITGNEANNTLSGFVGNDTLTGGAGNDIIDGGAGIDTASYSGNRAGFTLAQSGTSFIVTDATGAEGVDTVSNTERLIFADTKIALDITGGNAGTTAQILGAVFGAPSVSNTTYVGIGLGYLDGGMSYPDLMLLALNARLGAGFSNADEVNLLYQNLVGVLPSTTELDYYVGTITSGQFTQVSLAIMAADHSLNTTNINLVGLAQTGIEFV